MTEHHVLRRAVIRALALFSAAATLAGCSSAVASGSLTRIDTPGARIHKIRHVIVVMQENRSFDNYFGTFPGADGIPMKRGRPAVCVPDPRRGSCDVPYLDLADVNGGGPHSNAASIADVAGGKMNGFATERDRSLPGCKLATAPACVRKNAKVPDVMGYHDAGQLPNYWKYAKDFVLADHTFEAVSSSSIAAHLYMVSGWSALCKNRTPGSCVNQIIGPNGFKQFDRAVASELSTGKTSINLAWTDLTWLLYHQHVSWSYYVQQGTQPDCVDAAAMSCPPMAQSYTTPGIWNPLPLFNDVQTDHQLGNVRPLDDFLAAAKTGTLPAVSWVTPSGANSGHPPASIHQEQAYVTALVNAVMKSPNWSSTAIFLAWDDWGGFYDNVVPPKIDANGYGIRVPLMVISPYAKHGYIDHQTLSSDAFLKFIEDDFLGGARLNPKTDGRPDPRPTVRENAPQLGNLVKDFNFNQSPRPPVLLPTNPPTNSPNIPATFVGAPACVGCTTPPSGGKP